ncbi:MAG: hypothetical protein B6242_00085 [Anaerolineaceae bacterium 4572_78]|nr:MAG: hypothetical protein B6242_00085 [Anaerolineaceae bacterium 4572_78]
MSGLTEIGSQFIKYITGAIVNAIGLLVVIGFMLVFSVLLCRIDMSPLVETGWLVWSGKLTDFIPEDGRKICSAQQLNTDNNTEDQEWLVVYQVDSVRVSDEFSDISERKSLNDPCPGSSPRLAVIYDNDRGKPLPIIFPYSLDAPDRDFLGEGHVIVDDKQDIIPNLAKCETSDCDAETGVIVQDGIPELLIYGQLNGVKNQLTIFSFQQNTSPWQPPRDDPPRYQVIGSFEGSGGVSYNPDTKQVTVSDRGAYERAQLAVKNVYDLHGEGVNATFMADIGAASLAAPVKSYIDFALEDPLVNIFQTEFPEKLVLGFYKTLGENTALVDANENMLDFFAPDSQAGTEYNNNKFSYFGLPSDTLPFNVSVTKLEYFPDVEKTDVAVSYAGSTPLSSRVKLQAVIKQNKGDAEVTTTEIINLEVVFHEGKWKISRRL